MNVNFDSNKWYYTIHLNDKRKSTKFIKASFVTFFRRLIHIAKIKSDVHVRSDEAFNRLNSVSVH